MGIPVPTPEQDAADQGYSCPSFSLGPMPTILVDISGVEPGAEYWRPYLPNGMWACKPKAGCLWEAVKGIGPELYDTFCAVEWTGDRFYCMIARYIDGKISYLSGGAGGTNYGIGSDLGFFKGGTHQVIAPFYKNIRSISLLADQLGIEANQKTFAEPGGLSLDKTTETIRLARQHDGTCINIKR